MSCSLVSMLEIPVFYSAYSICQKKEKQLNPVTLFIYIFKENIILNAKTYKYSQVK